MLSIIIPLILALLSSQCAAVVIVFSNGHGMSRATSQLCKSGNDRDVCCYPLDLDINDGHGFGWFRAQKVGFLDIGSDDAFTAVYRKTTQPICSGELLAHQLGHRGWETGVLPVEGAGSALSKQSVSPAPTVLKWPDSVMIGGALFQYVEKTEGPEGEIFSYESVGDVRSYIYGRRFGLSVYTDSTKNVTLSRSGLDNATIAEERLREE